MWERTTVEKYTDLFLVDRQKQENLKKKSLFKTEHYIEEFKYVWIVVWVMMSVYEKIKDKEREEKERTYYAHF